MFPVYLLTDSGFWWFTVLYVVSVAIVVVVLATPLKRFATPVSIPLPAWVVALFTYLIIEQFFHQAEHVTQMYQFAFLGMSAHDAHGFVWFLDDEWNHFVFNGLYLIGLTIVFTVILKNMRHAGVRWSVAHTGYIFAFFVLEGWHMTEHTVRILQHVQGLCDQCPGIIDTVTSINRLVLHFWFNFIALTLPTASYVWFGIPGQVLSRLQRGRMATQPVEA